MYVCVVDPHGGASTLIPSVAGPGPWMWVVPGMLTESAPQHCDSVCARVCPVNVFD